MSSTISTRALSVDGEIVSQEGLVVSQDPHGSVTDMSAYKDGDVYYAHIGRDGVADVFSAPANTLSLEERLVRDLGGRRARRCRSGRRKTRHGRTRKKRGEVRRRSFRA